MSELTLYAVKPSTAVDAHARAHEALAGYPGLSPRDVASVLEHLQRAPWPVSLEFLPGTEDRIERLRDAFITDADQALPLAAVRRRSAFFAEIALAYQEV